MADTVSTKRDLMTPVALALGAAAVGGGLYLYYRKKEDETPPPHDVTQVEFISWTAPVGELIAPDSIIRIRAAWKNLTASTLQARFRLDIKRQWDFWTDWPSTPVEGEWVASQAAAGEIKIVDLAIKVPADWGPGTAIDLRLGLYGLEGTLKEQSGAYVIQAAPEFAVPYSLTPVKSKLDPAVDSQAAVQLVWTNPATVQISSRFRLSLRTSPGGAWLESPTWYQASAGALSQGSVTLTCPIKGGSFDNLSNRSQYLDAKINVEGLEGTWWGPDAGSRFQDSAGTRLFEVYIPAQAPAPQVSDLEVRYELMQPGSTGALNAGQVIAAPGQGIAVVEVRFSYTGPLRALAVCWGIKAGYMDFNNGAHLIDSPAMWSWSVLTAAEALEIQPQVVTLAAPAAFVVPQPGEYRDRSGIWRTINWGGFDTWVWMVDYQKLRGDYPGEDYLEHLADERYILQIDTDADPVNIR